MIASSRSLEPEASSVIGVPALSRPGTSAIEACGAMLQAGSSSDHERDAAGVGDGEVAYAQLPRAGQRLAVERRQRLRRLPAAA